MRIDRLLTLTESEGPGRRACLWVQGCSLHCPGCFNPHTWDPRGGVEVGLDELLATLDRGPEVEGVTLLGGEPFDQAVELAELGTAVRRRGLSVMTFSGYTLEELREQDRDGWSALLAVTDLLGDGRFDVRRPDRVRPWVGSTNQRFHFLTPRYRALAGALVSVPDRLEVRIRRDGTVFVNGQADLDQLRGLLDGGRLRPAPGARRPALTPRVEGGSWGRQGRRPDPGRTLHRGEPNAAVRSPEPSAPRR